MPADRPSSEEHPDEGDLRRQREPLDTSPASGPPGSREKHYEQTAPTSNDGRSETRTTFYAEEGDGSKDYKRLAKVNDGHYSDDREKRKKKINQRRDLQIFCSQTNLSSWQTQRAFALLDKIDDKQPFQRTEVLALAIITIIANQDERMIRQEEAYKELLDGCGFENSRIRKARQKLREYL